MAEGEGRSAGAADLVWVLERIEGGDIDPHTLSFYSLLSPNPSPSSSDPYHLTINISNDAVSFSSFLRHLTPHQHGGRRLRNLEFHHLKWQQEGIDSLRFNLHRNASVTLLAFHRNIFTSHLLSQLSDCLKTACTVTAVVFSGCSIGAGADLLISALRANKNLQELQILQDHIGGRAVKELSTMVESNSSLGKLCVSVVSDAAAEQLILPLLDGNRLIEVHVWGIQEGRAEESFKVAEFVPRGGGVLTIFQMAFPGCCRVARSLCRNLTAGKLDMTGVRLKSRWTKEFRKVMETNQTLKEVDLSMTCLKDNGVKCIAAGLFKNRCLETLILHRNSFTGAGIAAILCPLTRFSPSQMQANTAIRSITFGGEKASIGRDGVAAIVTFLTTNQTVTFLGIHDDRSLQPEDTVRVLNSLQRNSSLLRLSLRGCAGVAGEAVKKAVMAAMHVSPSIQSIDLAGTPLQGYGETTHEIVEDETEPPLVMPKTLRIFVCGNQRAGKTSLCNSVARNFIRIAGEEASAITTLEDGDTRISIWNVSGETELYLFREILFSPDRIQFFVVASSLFRETTNAREFKSASEIEEDVCYWLRFIFSNSRIAVSGHCIRPSVTVVFTGADELIQPCQNLQTAIGEVEKVINKYQGYIDVFPTVFSVDARSSESVNELSLHIRAASETILRRAPPIYEICNVLIRIMADWRRENRNKPAMDWTEFGDLCQLQTPCLRLKRNGGSHETTEGRRRAVLRSLHDAGEIIYLHGLGIVVLDLEWFCAVFPQLVKVQRRRTPGWTENGFINRRELEKLLRRNLSRRRHLPGIASDSEIFRPSELVRMMLKIESCYEEDPPNPNSALLVPSLLEEGMQKPEWKFVSTKCIFVGRCFECDDPSLALLLPRFFHRFQVNLHKKFMGLHGATYRFEKRLALVNINGVHVRAEFGGHHTTTGGHIDFLACSSRDLTETLGLLQQFFVPIFRGACDGVALTEKVIRPECVQKLLPHRCRRNQFVSLQHLKDAVLSVPAEGIYDYRHPWSRAADSGRVVIKEGFDLARVLLSSDEFREILDRRYRDICAIARELEVPLETEEEKQETTVSGATESNAVEASLAGIARGLETVLHRLNSIESEIKDLRQEIQGLRYYEQRLLAELHKKADYLMNYSVNLEERKVPNMFYFLEDGNYTRRLVTTVIVGMTALRLHMLCEFRREMHVVEDQMGIDIMQIDSTAVRLLAPYTKKFVKLITFALRIGAHLAVGMGQMIPDLSREISLLIGSSTAYGAGAGAAGVAGVLAAGGILGSRRDDQQDVMAMAAQQWITDLLKERNCSSGKDIGEMFGLWRVRYRDDGRIAWICRRHMYCRAREVIQVPI